MIFSIARTWYCSTDGRNSSSVGCMSSTDGGSMSSTDGGSMSSTDGGSMSSTDGQNTVSAGRITQYKPPENKLYPK